MAASCLSEHPASGHSLPNRRTHAAGHPPQMLAARCGMIRRIFALLPSASYPIRVVFHRVPSLHRTKITTFHDTAKLIGRFYRQILNIRAPCKEASVFPHGRRNAAARTAKTGRPRAYPRTTRERSAAVDAAGRQGSRPHSPNAPVTPPNHAAPIARAPVIQRVSAGRLSGTESSETPRRPTVRCGYGSGGCAPQVFARLPRSLVRPAPQFRRRQYPIRPGSARRRSNTSAPIGERSLRETFASRRQIPAARNTHATACTRPQLPAEAQPAKPSPPHNGRPASIWVGSRNKRSASRRPSCGTGGPHPPSPRCNGGWDTPSR